LYTAADLEMGERRVIKNEKVALDGLPSSTGCISCLCIKAVCFVVIFKMLPTIYGQIKMSDDDDDDDDDDSDVVDNLTH